MAPHLLLEELGQPFELKLVDRANRAHQSPEYLRLNPNGLIPVLVEQPGEVGFHVERRGELLHFQRTALCGTVRTRAGLRLAAQRDGALQESADRTDRASDL